MPFKDKAKKKPAKQASKRAENGRFVKGVSGNPNGRPRNGQCVTAILHRLLKENGNADKVAQALLDKALDGDLPAIKELLDRIEGRVPQQISGEGGGPVILRVEYASD